MARPHPRVLLAMPCEKVVPFPVHQAVVRAIYEARGWLIPYPLQSMPVHIARHAAIALVRDDLSLDYLCFVDSDQLFRLQSIKRLLSWERPVVAPLVVTRVGNPLPVAFTWTGGAYVPQTAAFLAYLRHVSKEQLATDPVQELPKRGDELVRCDAVGTGMLLLSREALCAIKPDHDGLFCSFAKNQGEDFSLMENFRAADIPIVVDSGCIVGHLTWYVRSAYNLLPP